MGISKQISFSVFIIIDLFHPFAKTKFKLVPLKTVSSAIASELTVYEELSGGNVGQDTDVY